MPKQKDNERGNGVKKKRDILFLCQFFYPEYISSAQLPYDTVLALQEAGFTVDALCGYPREYLQGGDIPVREDVGGIRIHRIKYLQLDRSGFLGRLINYFSFTFMVLLHLGELARYRTVVVYSNPPILPWIASWAKALFGTKLVFVAYDLYPEVATVTNTLREGNMICRLMNHINRAVYRRADAVVALSREMREYIIANRPISADRVTVIPNWHHDDHTPESPDNSFRKAAQGRFTVAYFGNMGTMQDMQTILDAIRILKDDEQIFFLFAGHGNKLETLKNTLREEGITNIAIHEFLHGQQFRDALAAGSCALISLEHGATGLCAPSKTYCYMQQGLPLIAIMDESDIVEDIRSGAGIWVRNSQSQKLADEIRALSMDPARAAEMARTSRALYEEKYTPGVCLQKYTDLFRYLLGQAGKES